MANKNAIPPKHSQFKKGQSGNPAGRTPVLPDLKDLMTKVLSEEKQGMTAAEAILRGQISKAVKGDTRAAEWLIDRGYGKLLQKVNFSGAVGVTDLSESELDNKIQELLKAK